MSNRQQRRKRQGTQGRRLGNALAGPYVAPASTLHEGGTNEEALEAIEQVLGGELVIGQLYRVRFQQRVGEEQGHPTFVGELRGIQRDMVSGHPEPGLEFVIRNPVLPAGAAGGPNKPFVLWPLDVEGIALATAADLERPLQYKHAGEPRLTPPPGNPPVQ